MTQKNNGIYRILNTPLIYDGIQNLFYHDETLHMFLKKLGATKDKTILDVGCGTAEFLKFIPDGKYIGFDLSERYVQKAKHKNTDRGLFFCESIDTINLSKFPQIDIVILNGILHHLSDAQIEHFFSRLRQNLAPNGFVLTLDPCFINKQNLISKLLVGIDRGTNVKTLTHYKKTSEALFSKVELEHIHQRFPPYDRCLQKLQF